MSDYRLLNDVQLWKARRHKKLDEYATEIPGKRELIDHIDVMAAREAKLRALHRKSGLGSMCAECVDDWPCNTIRILDGET